MEDKKSTVYFMIGIPGSGKSTYARTLGVPIYSSDNLREELTGDPNDHETYKNHELFAILHKRMIEALERGEDFVFDATNVESQYRKEALEVWALYDPYVIAVIMTTPLEVAVQRAQLRKEKIDRPVPEKGIKRMHRILQENIIDPENEAFDEIREVDRDMNERIIFRKNP